MNKKVSIIIPVYNGENYLKEAIDSAINQTYDNYEVIVVNDGSTDKTEEICKSYGNKIKYYKKKNGGVASALNLGISKMKGEYFSWLSHDDVYLPNKLEIEMDYIKKYNSNKIILYSDYLLINAKGKEFKDPIQFNCEKIKNNPYYAFLTDCLNGISMLIPKKAFDECGMFNEDLRCTQDYDMWLRMYNKGYIFMHIKELITKTRIHDKQDTNDSPYMLDEGNNIWMRIINNISDDDKIVIFGDLFNFYYEEAKFLNKTPYKNVRDYCISKCLEIDKNRYNKNKVLLKRNIKYYFLYLKNHGIKYSLKRLYRKLFK